MTKVESTFQKISKEKDKAPSYKEVVPKDDFRRGATMIGGALGVIPGSFIGGAALNRVLEAERMNTLFKTKGFKKLGPVGKTLTYLVPTVAGTAIGAGAGRYLLGSDKQYEKGRKSYNKQMKDPKIRKNVTDAYNQTKKAEQVFEKVSNNFEGENFKYKVRGHYLGFTDVMPSEEDYKKVLKEKVENLRSQDYLGGSLVGGLAGGLIGYSAAPLKKLLPSAIIGAGLGAGLGALLVKASHDAADELEELTGKKLTPEQKRNLRRRYQEDIKRALDNHRAG